MEYQNAKVLIERSSEPDCHFIGSWFVKAAEAQGLWSQALRDPSFREWVFALCDEYFLPDLECAAAYFFGELERQRRVIAMNGDLMFELAMMVHLGFFVRADQSYRLALPESVTLERVQQAALRVMSTAKDLGFDPVVEPELLLHTVPEAEAEAWREWTIQLRRLNSETYGEVQVAAGIRLSVDNAGFRILTNGASKIGHKMQLARRDWVLFAGG
ncbi:hypothetical protein ACFKHW_08135 [Bradyrhizobium lupini]|uniref:hypothetical protein n=1 Tax=Rhizobium lupini TaxID=136996 RepID=UPI00366AEA2A